jgi:hypothetical protein
MLNLSNSNVQVQQTVSVTNSLINGINQNNITDSTIATKNLKTYKDIIFPAPSNYLDYTRITQAIDGGTAVTYMTFNNKLHTIPPGILKQ